MYDRKRTAHDNASMCAVSQPASGDRFFHARLLMARLEPIPLLYMKNRFYSVTELFVLSFLKIIIYCNCLNHM